MTIGASLKSFLLDDQSISVMVGGHRIYPVHLPQNTKQLTIRYSNASGDRVVSSRRDLGLAAPWVQIDAWGPTYEGVVDLSDKVLSRLNAYQGYLRQDSPPSTFCQGAFFRNERDGYQPESKLYYFIREYKIWFEDPLA
jgi:hypothetical protein